MGEIRYGLLGQRQPKKDMQLRGLQKAVFFIAARFTMLIRQGRIWSATIEEAVEVIRAKYGPGQLRIYKALVQPRPGLVWWEFNIEIKEDKPMNSIKLKLTENECLAIISVLTDRITRKDKYWKGSVTPVSYERLTTKIYQQLTTDPPKIED